MCLLFYIITIFSGYVNQIIEDGVLPLYSGTLVHDHNTANYNYGTGNAECSVHIILYLKANCENTQNIWSSDMKVL